MAMLRKDALKRIGTLSQRVTEHLDKIERFPNAVSYNHWRHEARIMIDQIEAVARYVGERTGGEIIRNVLEWRKRLGISDE